MNLEHTLDNNSRAAQNCAQEYHGGHHDHALIAGGRFQLEPHHGRDGGGKQHGGHEPQARGPSFFKSSWPHCRGNTCATAPAWVPVQHACKLRDKGHGNACRVGHAREPRAAAVKCNHAVDLCRWLAPEVLAGSSHTFASVSNVRKAPAEPVVPCILRTWICTVMLGKGPSF